MTTFRSPLDDQLQGYLDHLTIERGVAANTLSSYRRDLRRYAEHLTLHGIDDLAEVTETDVSDFLVSLRRAAVGGLGGPCSGRRAGTTSLRNVGGADRNRCRAGGQAADS
jgi:site-specific recombinase XerD